ncbi:hypothetical protein Bbelb_157190 [Branchiostoma belcheri]|nr:hypothetical protein Bbelb_157190 [Branchiostoma belcheri]
MNEALNIRDTFRLLDPFFFFGKIPLNFLPTGSERHSIGACKGFEPRTARFLKSTTLTTRPPWHLSWLRKLKFTRPCPTQADMLQLCVQRLMEVTGTDLHLWPCPTRVTLGASQVYGPLAVSFGSQKPFARRPKLPLRWN